MNYKTTIEGHTLEFRDCYTGSCNPWALDYAHEHNLPLMITADMAEFLLIDGEYVYQLKGNVPESITTWEAAKAWIEKYASPRTPLSECIESLKEYKEKLESKDKEKKQNEN